MALQYYLKAKDAYPYDLAEVMEALDYALSYDDEQAEIYCFMGVFYSEQMKNQEKACYYFEQALLADISYKETYYHYADVLIKSDEFVHAKKLLHHLKKQKNCNHSAVLQLKALISERQGKYSKAIDRIKKAMKLSMSNNHISNLRCQLDRVTEKNKKS